MIATTPKRKTKESTSIQQVSRKTKKVEQTRSQRGKSEKIKREFASYLATKSHERYLLSTALFALFRLDREKAWDYMTEHFPVADPYVLKTMMELLLYETEFRFELPVAWGIFQRFQTLEENKESLDPDVTSDFLGTMALISESAIQKNGTSLQ